jgi:hypothetical protein
MNKEKKKYNPNFEVKEKPIEEDKRESTGTSTFRKFVPPK